MESLTDKNVGRVETRNWQGLAIGVGVVVPMQRVGYWFES